ncbi:DEAD/DEAH box helicase [Azospirillum oryzae]|uniref:DEAD/DEAH box helicase n=1 Tax=Azospirillum oryzae TaxID=286727 RepID=A0A6N1AJ69_9PROT|nr:DEAD/DEAH box helicase [Azospirillum oryzae]KAA0589942.1 DEAD/DEAH box helicase [Azospirillum oryzae]QKS51781.1 DEAD/DEAH box helicase [Azospirillum oryzae]GLR81409.1 CRISPR-associated helicase/endonuclease Cas3 [Azospirillum oryzae]
MVDDPITLARGHSRNHRGGEHYLADHLSSVQLTAAEFAKWLHFRRSDGRGAEIASLVAGLIAIFHDAAKASEAFQRYLAAIDAGTTPVRTIHAGPSAVASWEWVLLAMMGARQGVSKAVASLHAERAFSLYEVLLPVEGHHAGLGAASTCVQRLEGLRTSPEAAEAAVAALRFLKATGLLPTRLPFFPPLEGTRRDMFIRMVSSAAFDADRLDTENHFRPHAKGLRSNWMSIREVAERFGQNQQELLARVEPMVQEGRVSRVVADARVELHRNAVDAAGEAGLYRMEAPTGSGKTRAYMAFASQCVLDHGFRRIIIALPFTSIIDQTAQTLKEILEAGGSPLAVLEHHSTADLGDDEWQGRTAYRLAEENWDAPVVITTFVQLFESLLANRPGRMRKLHNMARSVIVLDEVQALPVGLLDTTMDVLHSLVEDCGCIVLFSTATQPPYEAKMPSLRGMPVREITKRPHHLTKELRRVRYDLLGTPSVPLTVGDIAGMTLQRPQSLVVTNTRRDATAIFDIMADQPGKVESLYYLSSSLCPAHRKQVIATVAACLDAKAPIHLVSTQVIEAGVDLDFPWGARAFGPLGSIVQTAGRVNRNGMLKEAGNPVLGTLAVFHLEGGKLPPGEYTQAANILLRLLPNAPRLVGRDGEDMGLDLSDPDFMRRYYGALIEFGTDARGIQDLRRKLDFSEVAERYRLIPDDQVAVCIDWEGRGHAALAKLLKESSRVAFRQCQQYIVQIPLSKKQDVLDAGLADDTACGIMRWAGGYDGRLGILL